YVQQSALGRLVDAPYQVAVEAGSAQMCFQGGQQRGVHFHRRIETGLVRTLPVAFLGSDTRHLFEERRDLRHQLRRRRTPPVRSDVREPVVVRLPASTLAMMKTGPHIAYHEIRLRQLEFGDGLLYTPDVATADVDQTDIRPTGQLPQSRARLAVLRLRAVGDDGAIHVRAQQQRQV